MTFFPNPDTLALSSGGRALLGLSHRPIRTPLARSLALPTTNHPSVRRALLVCCCTPSAGGGGAFAAAYSLWSAFDLVQSPFERRHVSKCRRVPPALGRSSPGRVAGPLPRELRRSDLPRRLRLRQVLQGEK